MVVDPEQPHPIYLLCCHCIDGRVPAEVDERSGETGPLFALRERSDTEEST